MEYDLNSAASLVTMSPAHLSLSHAKSQCMHQQRGKGIVILKV
jgi:hypothetical protein